MLLGIAHNDGKQAARTQARIDEFELPAPFSRFVLISLLVCIHAYSCGANGLLFTG
jgi:hypothetical protein